MSDIDQKPFTVDELTTAQPESTDPKYLAWKKQKIEASLKHADEHPDDVLTEQEMWQKHSLDY